MTCPAYNPLPTVKRVTIEMTRCAFVGNTALRAWALVIWGRAGGRACSLAECEFVDNTAVESGGGLWGDRPEGMILEGCLFVDSLLCLGNVH